jgi:hypothetical protein
MPYALASSDAELIAGMTDGRILHSPNRGASWEDVIRIGSVVAMATA